MNRPRLEELDYRPTPMGELVLRRRIEPATGEDVYEVRLGEEYLMSSAFTVAEEELSRLGLAALEGEDLDVVVGGLGLGYTAVAALAEPRVGRLRVIEALDAVVDWHERGLLPVSTTMTEDERCGFVLGDFFDLVRTGDLAQHARSGALDAILLDVDHTPTHHLDPSHADLYTEAGLRRVAALLRPGGVFALWSDVSGGPDFLALLQRVLPDAVEHEVRFANPVTGGTSANVVYVGHP